MPSDKVTPLISTAVVADRVTAVLLLTWKQQITVNCSKDHLFLFHYTSQKNLFTALVIICTVYNCSAGVCDSLEYFFLQWTSYIAGKMRIAFLSAAGTLYKD